MATINFVQARKICTAEELEVIEATRRTTLTQLSPAEVKKHITLARKLRNKWRDLATGQRRRSQAAQNARVTQENQRSRQKADLFAEVLQRLEQQQEHLKEAGKKATTKGATGNPPKQVRAAEHRSERAEVRKKLEKKRTRISKTQQRSQSSSTAAAEQPSDLSPAEQTDTSPAKMATKKAAKKTVAGAKSSSAKSAKASKKKPARKKSAKPSIRTLLTSKTSPTVAQPKIGSVAPKSTKQVRAKTKAKKARIQASGLQTRTRGHVSARGKRAQSRRDSRN